MSRSQGYRTKTRYRSDSWPEPTVDQPDIDILMEWEFTDDYEATDGCSPIEPDGVCPHGYPSWILYLGLI